jgi:hypothetical protein
LEIFCNYLLIFMPKFQDGMRLVKYYVLGPFVGFEMFACPHRDARRAFFKALTSDGQGLPHILVPRGSAPGIDLLTQESREQMLADYSVTMQQYRAEIADLQDRLFSSPKVDIALARELTGRYIATRHYLNVLLLFERWPELAKDSQANCLCQIAQKMLAPLAFL